MDLQSQYIRIRKEVMLKGDSHVKMSEEEIKIQTIYKFDDERTSEDATKRMEQYYKEYSWVFG